MARGREGRSYAYRWGSHVNSIMKSWGGALVLGGLRGCGVVGIGS